MFLFLKWSLAGSFSFHHPYTLDDALGVVRMGMRTSPKHCVSMGPKTLKGAAYRRS